MEFKIQPLTVGPIIGATTPERVRIWGRADFESTPKGPRRAFGAVRLRKPGNRFAAPQFFKMNPNFDMTGVTVLSGLEEQARYHYEIGWFFADLEPDDLSRRHSYDWSEAQPGEFTTGTADPELPRSFVFGSCRYLLRLFGGSFFDDRGDKTFRSIHRQIEGGDKIDLMLMVGDQIYADDLNFLAPDQSLDEYNKRYREVFSREYVRKCMSSTPTYMTLDDHEIEDNWPSGASERDWVVKYPAAMHAYLTYQVSHSPLFSTEGDRISGLPDRLWYTFSDGCADFFVADTRTERFLADDPQEREIISLEQLDALKEWLSDGSGRVKFIASAVPVFPDGRRASEDKWSGHLKQRTELLEFIRRNAIRRVVFLSGDIHCSMSAELTSPQAGDGFKVISVISSSFFWPYPHPRRSGYVLEGELSSAGPSRFLLANAGPVHPTDNFTRVSVDLERLKVEVFARKGEKLGEKTHHF